MEDKIKILIAFDIKDDRPYKAVRLYTANGQSIGFGEIKVNTIEEKKDLFHSEVGYITYAAYIEPDKLFKKSGEPIKELKTIDPDIKATDDPEEDEWVADQMKHLKDAKAKTDLYTEENLRQQYREYKRKRESKPIKETEPTEKNETVTELISTRGEQVMKDIEKEESNVEVESEEVDKIIYTPTKEFAPLAAYRGSDGNYYLANNSKTIYTYEEMLHKQEIAKEAFKGSPRGIPDGKKPELTVKDEPEKEFSLDEFLKEIG